MRFHRAPILIISLVVLVAAGPVTTAGAATTKSKEMRTTMLNLVNAARRNHNVRPLSINWELSQKARSHSLRMARNNSLYHTSNLATLVRRYRPSTWGENVGWGGTLKRVHRAFMRSSPHRANILNRRFHRIGVGVVRARGALWVTLDFYGG
jgi:uncharacterized protein YkwD